MSMRFLSLVAFLLLAFMSTWVMCAGAIGAEPASGAARLDVFSHPDGATYFALSLKPTADVVKTNGSDVVVLFDTSSSQTGAFRENALAALESLLAGLGPNDRVRLFAVDLNAIPMNASLAAPGSPEVAQAVAKLKGRTPLGATNMEAALTTAAASFSGETRPRACVYVGDGMSAASVLGAEKFDKLVTTLLDARVPVSSYAVGPRLDGQLLGALAGRTGGVVTSQEQVAVAEGQAGAQVGVPLSPAEAGKRLATVADGVVYWPVAVELPKDRLPEILPQRMPPLRADRDSVVIGVLKGEGPVSIKMTADTPAGAKQLAWDVTPGKSEQQNEYLGKVVELGRPDGGMSLPLVDSGTLRLAREVSDLGATNLAELAKDAMAVGNLDRAQQLVAEVLRRKPADAQAKTLAAEIEQRKDGGPAEEELNLQGGPAVEEAADGAFAKAFEQDKGMIAEQVTKDVQVGINNARKNAAVAGEEVIQDLKLQLENVRRMSVLDPDVRQQLVGQLQSALRWVQNRHEVAMVEKQQESESRATAEDRFLAGQELARKHDQVGQLMKRFHSLLTEDGYVAENYRTAEEQIAPQAMDIAVAENMGPHVEADLAQAPSAARLMRYYQEGLRLRIRRQQAMLASLNSVDQSNVAINDNEPILYPPVEEWNQLSERRKERSVVELSSRNQAEQRITRALEEKTTLNFTEAELGEVVAQLKRDHDIEIQLDKPALEEMDLGSDTLVTCVVKDISLRSALRIMLRPLELTYIIRDEVLLITSQQVAEDNRATRVYPVGDLVVPIRNYPTGGMGMMGGMGGGMGGMGGMGGGMGGMGGGMGMGGMGGGMGGMGGGMGGGFMNVPRDVVPRQLLDQLPEEIRDVMPRRRLPGGFEAFSVKDDPNTPVKAAAGAKAPAEPRPAKIDVSTDGAGAPETIWDAYFATHRPTEAAVRDEVRRLMGDKKYAHVIALIQSALRHAQAQPWMYEAMALAMRIDGRGDEEVERAVMSAVDWATTPIDLMYVGAYLSDIGLHKRALQVFQQVSQIAPEWPEAYMHGLRAAERANDVEGIEWATVGILSRAWPKEQAEVYIKAMRLAKATLEQLQKENRTKEAAEYKKALDEASARDVVVCVSWTGDADIDVTVKEPSGTVCSSRNPRTIAGGQMMGDRFATTGEDGSKEYSEVYVCPKAFAGKYEMLIRRVWGEVTAGKVNVDVFFNWNTKAAKRIQKRVALAEAGAAGTFDLARGRRKELLQEQQVANAAAGQLALREQLTAQRLAATVDPRSMMSMAESREDEAKQKAMLPQAQPGAVGYQPIIQTLPEGVMLPNGATAVISADRRYVRISVAPMFSAIPAVNTFNFVSGDSGTSNGGTGGQGYGGMGGGMGGGGMGY